MKMKISESDLTHKDRWRFNFIVQQSQPVRGDLENQADHAKSLQSIHNFHLTGDFLIERQRVWFMGDKTLFQGIGAKFGDAEIETHLEFDNPSTLISAIQSTQGKTCPMIFTAPRDVTYYHQTYENLSACDEKVSFDDSLCGSTSIKVDSFENKYYLFQAGISKESCDENEVPKAAFKPKIRHLPQSGQMYGSICFAYKGAVKERIKASISYFDADGNWKIEKNISFWKGKLDVSAFNKDNWKWHCCDIATNWKWTHDYFTRVKSPFSAKFGGNNWRIEEIMVQLDPNLGSSAYFDHVTISDEPVEGNADQFWKIKNSVTPSIMSASSKQVGPNSHVIEMVPGACATGHGLIGFYGQDIESAVDEEDEEIIKYFRSSWPEGTYLAVKRIQASSSAMVGTMDLKYDRREKSVKIDVAADSTHSLVNSFALADFKIRCQIFRSDFLRHIIFVPSSINWDFTTRPLAYCKHLDTSDI